VAPAFRKRCCELQDDYVRVTEPLCREIISTGGYKTMDAREIAQSLCVLMSGLDVEMHLRGRRYSVEDARRTVHALLAGIFPREFAAAIGSAAQKERKTSAVRSATPSRRRNAAAPKRAPRAAAKRQA
jgi:hypothetical protein